MCSVDSNLLHGLGTMKRLESENNISLKPLYAGGCGRIVRSAATVGAVDCRGHRDCEHIPGEREMGTYTVALFSMSFHQRPKTFYMDV